MSSFFVGVNGEGVPCCGCSERRYRHRPRSKEDLVHMLSLPMPRWLYRFRVTGSRRFSADLAQGALEISCVLTFQGDTKHTAKAKKLYSRISFSNHDNCFVGK